MGLEDVGSDGDFSPYRLLLDRQDKIKAVRASEVEPQCVCVCVRVPGVGPRLSVLHECACVGSVPRYLHTSTSGIGCMVLWSVFHPI